MKADRRDFASGMTLAWHGAAFGRAQKIPDLKPIIDRIVETKPKPKTASDLLRIVEGINRAMGGKDLRPAKREAA